MTSLTKRSRSKTRKESLSGDQDMMSSYPCSSASSRSLYNFNGKDKEPTGVVSFVVPVPGKETAAAAMAATAVFLL